MLKKIIIAVLLVSELFGSFALDNTRTSNEDSMDRLEAALPDGFEKAQLLEVVPKHYTAPNKDDIIFYQCRTILFLDDITEDYYKENVYPQIVDIENYDEAISCFVNEQPATLYRKGKLSYLCWVISPAYCAVLQYAPDSVSDADIKRMAESVIILKDQSGAFTVS